MQSKLEAARAVLAEQPKVLSVWLFGSTQQARARTDSDVDLALLVSEDLTLADHLELQEGLQKALGCDLIDLCILNRAEPVIQLEALRGDRLVSKDPQREAAFVSLASRRYEEASAMLARGLRYWKEARAAQGP